MITFIGTFLSLLALSRAAILPYDSKIVGGVEVDIADYPYTASLQKGDLPFFTPICGSSIISDRWILTAAHCVHPYTAEKLQVRTGSNDKNYNGTVIKAKQVIMHPNYAPPNTDYDIALVEVVSPFPLGKRGTQKIKLTNSEPKAGTKLTVTGWGRMSNEGGFTGYLRAVDVLVVPRATCESQYPTLITSRMFCAGDAGKDSCQGDSGGPIVIKNGEQVGVVSWGYNCADPKHPGVYANVAYFRDWIRQNSGV